MTGTPSMKKPTTTSSRLTVSRNSQGGISAATIIRVIWSGSPMVVTKKPNRMAFAATQKIMPTRGAVSMIVPPSECRLCSR